jgi:hypothetical protein
MLFQITKKWNLETYLELLSHQNIIYKTLFILYKNGKNNSLILTSLKIKNEAKINEIIAVPVKINKLVLKNSFKTVHNTYTKPYVF